MLEDRTVPAGVNPAEIITTGLSAAQLAQTLVGPGVSVNNATFTGGAGSTGSFSFTNPAVVGFGQGIVMTSGSAADVVGPNTSDSQSTSYGAPGAIGGPGDPDLTALAGYPTYDAAVLEFDFVPTANQVVFQYAFASDEYPEWVSTPYNDVFAFYVNQVNYATVRQTAGDPNSPFVPVAVNNINNGNPLYPGIAAARPDLFRANYYNPNGPSAIDLEQDGITSVLTFQAPVNPGVVNHMKLAIADASDGVYDSAVFIQAGSLVSNENPVADLSLSPQQGAAPLQVTAIVEGIDPNNAPLTYSINWGDGTPNSTGPLNLPVSQPEKTALVNHTYANPGEYIVTLTVSNGTLSGMSTDDVKVTGTSQTPTVTSVSPFSGPTMGGTTVVITGTNLTGATAVAFGANAATSFIVNSASQITAVSPAGTGTVDVTVTTPIGTSSTAGTANDFTYSDVAGPTLSSMTVNGGDMFAVDLFGEKPVDLVGNNSIVEQLYVTFNVGVTLSAGAFRLDAGTVVETIPAGVVPANSSSDAVGIIADADPATLDSNGGYKGYRLRFTSNDANGSDYIRTMNNSSGGGLGNISTALKDGYYLLNIFGANVHEGGSVAGTAMVGNSVRGLWALFGSVTSGSHSATNDSNDGSSFAAVGNTDLSEFANTYGSSREFGLPPAYNANLDYNLSGEVSNDDLSEFILRYGTEWAF